MHSLRKVYVPQLKYIPKAPTGGPFYSRWNHVQEKFDPKHTTARDASRAINKNQSSRRRAGNGDKSVSIYGQRLDVSSHPAARTGCGAGIEGGEGTGMRVVT